MNEPQVLSGNPADLSIISGSKNELVVFATTKDREAFLELLKLNGQQNGRTLITLNSYENIPKLSARLQDYGGKIFLLLGGGTESDKATQDILSKLSGKNIKDIRPLYGISEDGNASLENYLKNKLQLQEKNANLAGLKNSQNADHNPRQSGISDTQHLESGTSGRNTGEPLQNGQPRQAGSNAGGQTLGGTDAGNGYAEPGLDNSGDRTEGRPTDGTQPRNAAKNQGNEDGVGGVLPGRTPTKPNKVELKYTTQSSNELDSLIQKYRGQNLNNGQIAEVISAAASVSKNHQIILINGAKFSEDLLDICAQYKSGGMAKEGRGILDEYYTDEKIVDAVRNLVQEHFRHRSDIKVLEPSVGTGNFLEAAKSLGIKTDITAFEINETTARITKIRHPDAEVNLRSFETEFIDEKGNKKNFSLQYDLVIGNPPYGDHRGLYKGLGEEPKISKYEDYFVKRSLDSLKEGGILAMVLPSGWLNRQNSLKNAQIKDGFRLPSGAFSGTQVGTDIVILKKDSRKISENISDYFERNPERILGEIRQKTNRFGKAENFVHGDLETALSRISQLRSKNEVERIGNLFEDLPEETVALSPVKEAVNSEKKELNPSETLNLDSTSEKISLVLTKLESVKFKSPAVLKEIEKYSLLQNEISEKPEKFNAEKISEVEKKAEKLLASQFEKNSEYRLQTSPEIKKGVLKYQFQKPDAVVDASIHNNRDITTEQVEAFRDTDYDGRLQNQGKHYKFANYIDGSWVHDFYYAEGNIYAKLEQLERDFKDKNAVGGTADQYEKQKALLRSVLPKPKTLDQISISPNHEFVHKFSLGMVEKEKWNPDKRQSETLSVPYNLAEKFKEFVGTLSSEAFAGSSSWEVRSFVDNESVTGSDKERNALVRERRKAAANDLFQKFLKEELPSDIRERFVQEFNRNYNHIYVPDYSKFPLFSKVHQNFKGRELRLTEVQKAGIGRQTTKGVGLLAHEVGFGKTLSGILSMHEAMERGNAKRPLIVVPNDSILKQWVDTIFETIPNTRLNILGNLGKDYDLSKFDNKDGEISIVTYEGFNNIGFSEEVTQRLASKFSYISESEMRSANSISERDFQKEIEKEKELVGKMKRGKVYDWEDFKFDHLTYDEVHNANHIVGKVRIEDRRFSSDFRSQNQQTSKLGINTWMAAQYIQEQNDGRNVTLLSATPFTNKPLEYYSILSLIANKRLEESGYFNVNTFFETFMEADNDMEIDAKGDVKFKANVRRFKNNSLFQQLLSEFIDIKGEEDNPELRRPNKINKEYKIEQNDLTREQYDRLNENFSESEKGAILTHILNARLIAISPYLSPYYDGEQPSIKVFIEDSPKLRQTMALIQQNKKDLPEAGQIIYSELAVAEFPKIKEYLVEHAGYKPDEIGIITGAATKAARLKLQDDFNAGKIKIIIGSEAVQEGMNLQTKTSDIYMLSLPYNFTSLRQVEGRAWRQGNQNENVRINFMLTNDSIDVFMLQKLQAKQSRYLEAMKKGADVLDVSDISTQELKTAIITSPDTRANIEVELIKRRIENEKSRFLADNAFILRKHQDFMKVQEEVTKAQHNYNRILGYSQDGTANADYWKNQLPFYQKSIDSAKILVAEKIDELSQKGVNVLEIEQQTRATEEKIAELDEKIEGLPEVRETLVAQYRLEKEAQLKANEKLDYIKERADENVRLFGADKAEIEVIEEKADYRIKR